MTESGSIRVFVSYSHDSKDLKDRVLELADRLCGDGMDCHLDQYEASPPEGWPRWMINQVEDAEFVLIVCTANYNARFRGKAPKGTGLGGKWEGAVITQELYDAEANNVKFVPVLMSRGDTTHIPIILKGATYYDCSNDAGYEGLYRRITGQHFIPKPEIGSIRKLPTKERRTARPPMAREEAEPGGISAERFEGLTKYARQRIAEAATQWLSVECDPFVMPALSRRVQRAEAMASRCEADSWEPLNDDECRDIVLAKLPEDRNRIRIFSDSGMGKTTLLHHCEQQNAVSDDGCVPIRMPSLSSYDWRSNVITALANRVMHPFLPRGTDEATRVQWLQQLIQQNKVVFLFDAVDQADDQLAGFGQFMQSADVCHCPVIMTGRPEVEHTRAQVFHEANWDTLRVEPFDERRIRVYLSDLSNTLLAKEKAVWDDDDLYAREQQWQDLLHVPLLLQLMRCLARGDAEGAWPVSLRGLHNRHSIYQVAVRHLVEQGWKSLSKTPHAEDLLDHDDVEDCLTDMAWVMVSGNNFTSIFKGEAFRQWRSDHRQVVRALEQVDLTTRCSLLDSPGKHGMAWRHLSFCEYFAGLSVAGQERRAQETIAREHGRDPQWRWVFRFALSELEAQGNCNGCAELARDLIRFGNPFRVYDAIRGDKLKLPESLDTLCRWLVHRDLSGYEDWNTSNEPPQVNSDVVTILDTLLARQYRDSRCLHAAWDLLHSSSDPRAIEIRNRFLAEFHDLASGTVEERETAHSLSLGEHFLPCPPPGQEKTTFMVGKNAERSVRVEPFYLGKTTVTNRQFELFDPSHQRWRGQSSSYDESPVVGVSWYMAVMFCTWLGEGHRLPTEDEWEVACRADTTTAFWWGTKSDWTKCNSKESGLERATPADPAHANSWGFMDMLGNVLEWCQHEHHAVFGPRVFRFGRFFHRSHQRELSACIRPCNVRGGSFDSDSDSCRSSARTDEYPHVLRLDLGFRMARTCP